MVVYNRWTGMTGLERVDWNGGITNVAVWGVRGQNKFRYFRGSISVATAPSAKIKLAKSVVCCMLYTCMRYVFLTYAPYTGNLTQSKKLHNIYYVATWSC